MGIAVLGGTVCRHMPYGLRRAGYVYTTLAEGKSAVNSDINGCFLLKTSM